jgi:replicative DNA helicase
MNVIDLPKNIEIERNILGSLLIDKKSLSLVINYLKEDIFYDYKHKQFQVLRQAKDQEPEPHHEDS